ncbi:MAG: hypothetical protein SV422_13540 [Pseudomonadota bacterium]|nr:hypothetical protein [Pseudomonadota bacterium]
MSLSRRHLLQYTGAGCALALITPALEGATSMRVYEVHDNVALPRFAAGTRVVADASVTAFDGDGLYLYPAWGEPRLYAVQASSSSSSGRLEFRNPGSGQLLWTQTAALDAHFAGKVIEEAASAALASACPALAVPVLPA